jgi:hypothetical protein
MPKNDPFPFSCQFWKLALLPPIFRTSLETCLHFCLPNAFWFTFEKPSLPLSDPLSGPLLKFPHSGQLLRLRKIISYIWMAYLPVSGNMCLKKMKQYSTCRHVAPFRHIILIPSPPYFALAPQYWVRTIEAANTCTSFIVLGLGRPRLELTIYDTRGSHAR